MTGSSAIIWVSALEAEILISSEAVVASVVDEARRLGYDRFRCVLDYRGLHRDDTLVREFSSSLRELRRAGAIRTLVLTNTLSASVHLYLTTSLTDPVLIFNTDVRPRWAPEVRDLLELGG